MGRPKRLRAGIAVVVGEESANEEAGRWLTFASRSSRARTSRAAGRRNRMSGERANPAPRANRTTPAMRMRRGANCQAPAHEAARNRIRTASAKTSGGHTRSSRSTRRAQARERREPPAADRWLVRVLHRRCFTAMPQSLLACQIVRDCLRRKFQASGRPRSADSSRPKRHFNHGGSVSRPINSS